MTRASMRAPRATMCTMCDTLAAPTSECDRPVLDSGNFVVLPSLGSLVEGWLLILPKTHAISMGGLSSPLANEMLDLKDYLWSVLESTYGCAVAFEHGPAAPRRAVGCGVDHAHLHLVPVSFNVVRAAAPHLPEDTLWSRANWNSCRTAYETAVDYLYVEQRRGDGQIAVGPGFPGQVLRRAIAGAIGRAAEYDWRKHPQLDTITKTLRTLRRLRSHTSLPLRHIA